MSIELNVRYQTEQNNPHPQNYNYCNPFGTTVLRIGSAEKRNRYVPLKKREIKRQPRKEQVSHIFSGEDPKTIKESNKRHYYLNNRSAILFNDYYYTKPKQTNPQKRTRYVVEQEIKDRTLHPYSDEFYLPPQRKQIIQKKIDAQYLRNPIKTFSKQELEDYNQSIINKNKRRYEGFEKTFGSSSCKRVLGGVKARNNLNDSQVCKITNNDPNINQNSRLINMNENKEVPYWAKKHFKCASCERRGHAMQFI